MIQVTTAFSKGNIISLKISGHANSAEKGKDLVCAGVSCISTGLLNALDQLANQDCELILDSNLVSIHVKRMNHDSQLILQAALIQLRTMQKKYKKFIKIENTEV